MVSACEIFRFNLIQIYLLNKKSAIKNVKMLQEAKKGFQIKNIFAIQMELFTHSINC